VLLGRVHLLAEQHTIIIDPANIKRIWRAFPKHESSATQQLPYLFFWKLVKTENLKFGFKLEFDLDVVVVKEFLVNLKSGKRPNHAGHGSRGNSMCFWLWPYLAEWSDIATISRSQMKKKVTRRIRTAFHFLNIDGFSRLWSSILLWLNKKKQESSARLNHNHKWPKTHSNTSKTHTHPHSTPHTDPTLSKIKHDSQYQENTWAQLKTRRWIQTSSLWDHGRRQRMHEEQSRVISPCTQSQRTPQSVFGTTKKLKKTSDIEGQVYRRHLRLRQSHFSRCRKGKIIDQAMG
jgi:hypothetical protein